MILTPEIHAQILDALFDDKDRAIVLPDFCYDAGRQQPRVLVDGQTEYLNRVLYRQLIGPLEPGQRLYRKPGTPTRNVNPYLFTLEPEKDQSDRRPNQGDLNRVKTHCPKNHPLSGDNLIVLRDGRRRCRRCHNDNQAAYRARKATP